METIAQGIIAPETNFKWIVGPETGAGFTIIFFVPKTWYNRWKWWFSTTFFLPGTYEWTPPSTSLSTNS